MMDYIEMHVLTTMKAFSTLRPLKQNRGTCLNRIDSILNHLNPSVPLSELPILQDLAECVFVKNDFEKRESSCLIVWLNLD